ncbi:MAG: hypothetical protein DRR06_08710 [Gammaproteobacteria bacterium]|nr:MAG: hypothetical protein DRR06_08710 [Gammaproteobacteria bacterium]
MTHLIACPECDLAVDIPTLAEGERAACPRCKHVLSRKPRDGFSRSLAFAVGASVLLAIANFYPFLSLQSAGLGNVMTLPETAFALYNDGLVVLAALVLGFIVIMPIVMLAAIIVLLVPLATEQPANWLKGTGKVIFSLTPWDMVEVFVIGVIVSLIKLAALATVELGIGFWAYAAFGVCFVGAIANLDRFQVWEAIERVSQQ